MVKAKARANKRPRAVAHVRHSRAMHKTLDLQHRLENIKDSLGEINGALSNKAALLVARSIKKAKRESKRVNRYVHDKPYRSVSFAVVALVCLGLILRR